MSSRNSAMPDMELAGQRRLRRWIEQERGWGERMLTEGRLLELYEAVGDRRRREDALIGAAMD